MPLFFTPEDEKQFVLIDIAVVAAMALWRHPPHWVLALVAFQFTVRPRGYFMERLKARATTTVARYLELAIYCVNDMLSGAVMIGGGYDMTQSEVVWAVGWAFVIYGVSLYTGYCQIVTLMGMGTGIYEALVEQGTAIAEACRAKVQEAVDTFGQPVAEFLAVSGAELVLDLRRRELRLIRNDPPPRAIGFDDDAIEAFMPLQKHIAPPADRNMCSICHEDIAINHLWRREPGCGHGFHAECVDPWLRTHERCPMCNVVLRRDVLDLDDVD